MAIDGRGHEHVGAQVRTQGLPEFDEFAEQKAAVESVRYFPGQLGQHAEEGGDQIGDAQVQNEEVHAGEFLTARVPVVYQMNTVIITIYAPRTLH